MSPVVPMVPLDQTRAPVDYEGGAYDPGSCPMCGSDDPRVPLELDDWGHKELCTHSFHRVCDRPTLGWYCTRPPGHDGPCAAHPRRPRPSFARLFWDLLVERFGLAGAWALVVIQGTVLVQFGILIWLIFFS